MSSYGSSHQPPLPSVQCYFSSGLFIFLHLAVLCYTSLTTSLMFYTPSSEHTSLWSNISLHNAQAIAWSYTVCAVANSSIDMTTKEQSGG